MKILFNIRNKVLEDSTPLEQLVEEGHELVIVDRDRQNIEVNGAETRTGMPYSSEFDVYFQYDSWEDSFRLDQWADGGPRSKIRLTHGAYYVVDPSQKVHSSTQHRHISASRYLMEKNVDYSKIKHYSEVPEFVRDIA